MYKLCKKVLFLAAFAYSFMPTTSQAVPSFARQTGMDCAACHTSFPELTPFGREFKLNGYTLGERQFLPIAAMMQFSDTYISKSRDNTGAQQVLREGDPQFDLMSIFISGKLTDYAGMFMQWTYSNNSDQNADGQIRHHSHMDNTDLRLVYKGDLFDKNLVLGLNVNNNPTVQDVWNSTPAWGFPFSVPNLPHPGPSFGTTIDGGLAQQVAGLGAYFWWDRHLYGELSFYGNATGPYRFLSEGDWSPNTGARYVGRDNPYWRLAWNEEWGPSSLMVGTYGMQIDQDVPGMPADRYTDTAFDAQYQYLSDPHIVTFQTTYIHEKIDYRGSYDPTCSGAGACNQRDHINTFKAKASYLYDRKYGASLAFFDTTGSNDSGVFSTGNNPVTKPDNRGYIMELDYNPWTFARVSLQYTGYTKFDGSNQVDAVGLKPHDRNMLFLSTWFAF